MKQYVFAHTFDCDIPTTLVGTYLNYVMSVPIGLKINHRIIKYTHFAKLIKFGYDKLFIMTVAIDF